MWQYFLGDMTEERTHFVLLPLLPSIALGGKKAPHGTVGKTKNNREREGKERKKVCESYSVLRRRNGKKSNYLPACLNYFKWQLNGTFIDLMSYFFFFCISFWSESYFISHLKLEKKFCENFPSLTALFLVRYKKARRSHQVGNVCVLKEEKKWKYGRFKMRASLGFWVAQWRRKFWSRVGWEK